jgi:NAD(P)-dependent dehydrogenase (short-subunit alcohol dehydrogenase family)
MSQAASHTSKIAIVTGGSRGIGRSIVENLARWGVRVIFTFHTHREDADAVVATTKALGAEAFALKLDTGRVADFDAFAHSVQGVQGVLAQLVRNASTTRATIIATCSSRPSLKRR